MGRIKLHFTCRSPDIALLDAHVPGFSRVSYQRANWAKYGYTLNMATQTIEAGRFRLPGVSLRTVRFRPLWDLNLVDQVLRHAILHLALLFIVLHLPCQWRNLRL